jgi:hypothetical protein
LGLENIGAPGYADTAEAHANESHPMSSVRQARNAGTPATEAELLRELQEALNSHEDDLKRLLMESTSTPEHEVQCDVVREGNMFKCHICLHGRSDQKVCIFEALRTRKGRMRNPEYRIALPAADPRMLPLERDPASEPAAKDRCAALYCGRVRSYHLHGTDFVAWDDGVKPERVCEGVKETRLRRQMAAMSFHKSAQSGHTVMHMLVPNSNCGQETALDPDATADCLSRLRSVSSAVGETVPAGERVPAGTRLLSVVPPQWNKNKTALHSAFTSRARCVSNKNMQLADVSCPDQAVLKVGKLRAGEYNLDFAGSLSPFQAFAAALAIFDNSSVRRRF